jgi:hypothetical protein
MLMSVEQSVECLAGKTEVLGENLPQRRFVHHKFQMTRPGFEHGQWSIIMLHRSPGATHDTSRLAVHVIQQMTSTELYAT